MRSHRGNPVDVNSRILTIPSTGILTAVKTESLIRFGRK